MQRDTTVYCPTSLSHLILQHLAIEGELLVAGPHLLHCGTQRIALLLQGMAFLLEGVHLSPDGIGLCNDLGARALHRD